jgi:hypothetical protein
LELVRSGGQCQAAPPGDVFCQREVAESARNVSEKVHQVLAALQVRHAQGSEGLGSVPFLLSVRTIYR